MKIFDFTLDEWFNIFGTISLLLAPFTGVTIVTAVAFFVLAMIFNEDK